MSFFIGIFCLVHIRPSLLCYRFGLVSYADDGGNWGTDELVPTYFSGGRCKLYVDDSLIAEGKKAFGCSLVGKILMKKAYNKQSLLSVMENLWKLGLGFQAREVE